ncbi:MAG: hypothetical protein U1C51_09575 [Candidatus Izemoplasmatales bacterium]|jgi:hypothetical protein|nr:hypothetical protein [bacterium]MDZ4197478.1 hypothetical protein [Candidatus Izemoplasmatales bacterium]
MLDTVLSMTKQKKFRIFFLVYFVSFVVIYLVLDSLNGGYPKLIADFGWWLVALNLFMNVFMSAMSAYMMNLSSAYVELSGKEGKGSFATSFAVLFGMLTYGCTTCVIAFFATIGIAFSVLVLPLAGFPYKIIAFILLIGGYFWLTSEIKKGKCKIIKPQNEKDAI